MIQGNNKRLIKQIKSQANIYKNEALMTTNKWLFLCRQYEIGS